MFRTQVGQPLTYVVTREVRNHLGTTYRVRAGTELIDGYWATLRRLAGRKSVNTGGPDDEYTRDYLRKTVRFAQFLHWYHTEDRLVFFGGLLKKHREAALAF